MLPIRFHDLRHGATLVLAAGADLEAIQDMFGNASGWTGRTHHGHHGLTTPADMIFTRVNAPVRQGAPRGT